jgi:recombination endonuclease VII
MGSVDPEGRAAINRRYYEKHREELKQKHREYWKTYKRRSRRSAPIAADEKPLAGKRTRNGHAIWAWIEAAWAAQDGKCYLCGDPISLIADPGERRTAMVDHDHECCPYGKSCPECRRGLACNPCNILLGLVKDDIDRLELIARNARIAWARPAVS